jgi:hypothetical protein
MYLQVEILEELLAARGATLLQAEKWNLVEQLMP